MEPAVHDVVIESEDEIEKLLHERDKLVVRCFHQAQNSVDDDNTLDFPRSKLFKKLGESLPEGVAACYANLAVERGVGKRLGLVEDGQSVLEVVPRWLFFIEGVKVYTAPDSIPWPQLSRLVALLERNPDTLRQLGRQEEISRRQQQSQEEGSAQGATRDGEKSDGSSHEALSPAARIFISGDRSQVGKSSICLGLLGALLEQGLRPSELAYIKPATQCEKPQLVTAWCEKRGVACRGIGPVVFYKGFTREFLKGGVGSSADLLEEIRIAVEDLSRGKKVVVIDGVGYPAVGSICGVSNGDVAAALEAPVLLVGKSGVGDAVDSYNLNACLFEAHGVRVLGGVFNRLSVEGFYSLERCKEAVTLYFSQAQPRSMPYGFVPEIPALKSGPAKRNPNSSTPSTLTPPATSRHNPTSNSSHTLPATATTVGASEESTLESLPVTAIETEEELSVFVDRAGEERLVVLDFGAPWCKNCQALVPYVHDLPSKFQGRVAVVTADVDEATDVADERSVSAIPHFMFIKGGREVDVYGGNSEQEIEKRISRHLGTSTEASSSLKNYGSTEGSGTGAVSHTDVMNDGQKEAGSDHDDDGHALLAADSLIEAFSSHVDLARLLKDIQDYSALKTSVGKASTVGNPTEPAESDPSDGHDMRNSASLGRLSASEDGSTQNNDTTLQQGKEADIENPGTEGNHRLPGTNAQKPLRKTREEIEAEAAEQGASGS